MGQSQLDSRYCPIPMPQLKQGVRPFVDTLSTVAVIPEGKKSESGSPQSQ